MIRFRRLLAVTLIVSITGLGLPLPAQAAMLSTDSALAVAQRDRITGMLEREDVRLRLESDGVNPSDVKARVAALGDQEVAQLAARIDTLPAGADGLGALVGALVLIFLVLLLTDLLGLTHVFPFTKPIR